MQFSIFSLLALAAAAVPRANGDAGSWSVSYRASAYANGYETRVATAIYTNSNLNSTITATCSYKHDPTNDPTTDENICDPRSFSYSLGYDEASYQTITLQQTVPLWGEQVTVFGEARIEVKCPGAGTVCGGEAVVQVTKAIA